MSRTTAGGRLELSINGEPFSPVADVEWEESNLEIEAVTNQDGTVNRSVKPKPYKCELTLRDNKDVNISLAQRLMNADTVDVSGREVDTRRVVLMTGAFCTGTPKRNSVTGEISGIMIEGAQLRYA